jgi:ubiquinone/menaquinone biosynthesis C-methylase UbiE
MSLSIFYSLGQNLAGASDSFLIWGNQIKECEVGKVRGYWSLVFKTGVYDRFMPLNYNLALKEAFFLLTPAPQDHVLDAGCGSGSLFLHAVSWLRNGGRMTAIDIDAEGIQAAAFRARELDIAVSVSLRTADLTVCAESERQMYDGVLSLFSLYVIPGNEKRLNALKNIVSWLKPQGRLVLTVPSENYNAKMIIKNTIKIESEQRLGNPLYRAFRRLVILPIVKKWLAKIQQNLENDTFHKFTKEELLALLISVGLKPEQIIETYGGSAYHVVAKK